MTLQELSPQYARQAETVARRLRELRQQELAEGDPQAAQTLRQRQQELRPLLPGGPGAGGAHRPLLRQEVHKT